MPTPTEPEVLVALARYRTHINDDNFRAWRDEKRQEYKSVILAKLNELECPTGEWEFPPDFGFFMKHIDSLEGGGWGGQRLGNTFIFWEGFESSGTVYTGKELDGLVNDI
ncbi:hypothetical protein ACHAPU_000948 [Fusarium lateritium]